MAGVFLQCLVCLPATDVLAQGYPVRPIRYIAPSSVGSGNDFIARVVANDMMQALGQQIIVDNRAGAGGNLAADLAAKRPLTVEQVPRALARGCDPVAGCKCRT